MYRKVLAWMLAAIMMLSCGVLAGSAETTGPYVPEEGATIELFNQKTEVVEVLGEIIADFEALYPGVTVTLTSVEDAETVLSTRVTTGDIPDIMGVYGFENTYQAYYDAGYVIDLSNEPFMQNVEQSLLDQTEYKGIQFCLPMTVSTYGLYYRADLFEAAGITEAPKTYDEFIADLQKLQEYGIERPLALDFGGSANQITERVLGCIDPANPEECAKIAAGEMDIADSEGFKGYAKLLSDIKPYATEDALGMNRDSAVSDIVNGVSACMFNGSWLLSQFLAADPDIQIAYCPIPSPIRDSLMVPVNQDTAFAVSAHSEYPQACLAFVEYLSRPEVAQKYYEVDGNISMIKGVSYDKAQLMDVYNVVMEGNSFNTIGNRWPSWDLRGEIAACAQGYFEDEDLDAFLEGCATAIDEIYND